MAITQQQIDKQLGRDDVMMDTELVSEFKIPNSEIDK